MLLPAGRALGLIGTAANQLFEFGSAILATVFIDRHTPIIRAQLQQAARRPIIRTQLCPVPPAHTCTQLPSYPRRSNIRAQFPSYRAAPLAHTAPRHSLIPARDSIRAATVRERSSTNTSTKCGRTLKPDRMVLRATKGDEYLNSEELARGPAADQGVRPTSAGISRKCFSGRAIYPGSGIGRRRLRRSIALAAQCSAVPTPSAG
jgi:hypothetical protein